MFGQQFANPVASAAKWMFFGFVGIVLMAIFLGADIKDATWFNSDIAAAQAWDLNVETSYKEQQYQLALEQEQIRLQAESERLAQELATQKALDAQEVANDQTAFETWMTVLIFVGGTLSVAIIIVSIAWAISRRPVKAASEPNSKGRVVPAHSDEQEENKVRKYWHQRREWARDNEEWFRSVALLEARLKMATDPKSANKAQRDNLPLAI